jgi:hypothetical protein
VRLQSLRARLFAAIALVALLSLALALALGAILTRRAVERNTLRDVSAQFDLLVERERGALLPFSLPRSLSEVLERQDERVLRVPLDGSSSLLPPERAAELRRGAKLDGTLETDGTRYFYSARLVNGKGYMLIRPSSSTTSAWRPHVEGLVAAAVATAGLAALIAFLLARAMSPRRREASPGPLNARPSFPSKARGSSRSSPRASTRSRSRSRRRARRSAPSCSRSVTS